MNDKKRLLWLSYSFVLISLLVTLFFFLHAQSRYLQYKTLLLNEINAVFLDSYAQLRNLYVAYNNVPFLPANELLMRNKQFAHIKFIPLPNADLQTLRAPDIFANLQQIKQNLDFITHNHLATLGLIQYARDYVIVTPYRPYHDLLFSRQADQALQQMSRIDPTWQQRPYDAGDFRGCRVYITTPYRENYSGLKLVSMLMPLYTEGKLQAVAIADIRSMIFRHITASFNQQHNTQFFLNDANTPDSFLLPCSQQRINIAYSKLSLLSASDLLIALASASTLVLLLAWVLRVKNKIYRDELTGLHNRYYVNDHLRRLPSGFSVLVLDSYKQSSASLKAVSNACARAIHTPIDTVTGKPVSADSSAMVRRINSARWRTVSSRSVISSSKNSSPPQRATISSSRVRFCSTCAMVCNT